MFGKFTLWLAGLCLAGLGTYVHAENLMQVYQAAQLTSPDLRVATADNDAAGEEIKIARSALLPQLSLSGSSGWTEGARENAGAHSRSSGGTLSLSQTLFNMSSWQALTLQEKQADLRKVTYWSTQQSLILDVATAYFNVLKSVDTLSYTEAEKNSVCRLLEQTTLKFQAGSLAVTDMQNVRAQYDQVLSTEVSAQNEVNNSAEALREASGLNWKHLAALNTEHFKANKVSDVKGLLKQAENHSLRLWSSRLSREIAKAEIETAQTGHMPTISLNASIGISGNRSSYDEHFGKSISGSNQVSVSLSLPLYSGGGVSARVKQAEYDLISASEQEEGVHRNIMKSIRSAFNNINSAVTSIKANEQAVKSAQASQEATLNGYQAGTRTMLDVLDATTTVYRAQRSLSEARYNYLLARLTLKKEQGILSIADLRACNDFLGKEKDIPFSE
ncbi:outer membrane channel protein TolC [Pantoea sp. Bo_2]|uniref:Outer membrane channel protein TolC n=1 Tax=Candidatus Pantoea gossypiicola TaxID=2608008 RepID=A0AB34CCI3_9GAMM|nr:MULTISPECIES: outer membrane channel protein TolC [Pantoea]KAA5920958.1 outer membrane channel protein TolC [Pantoea sp. VH_8]KAA5928513.1 outer membrane channel protein TolC [Pantoea sp. VH_4]KAA5937507.1 outer membrane channel protein TolC [Pantoea sp. VH_3]KAA5948099.1 outer membrane channel protein TolC [Pantoea sp. VH_25]KAA5948547.1 outer membrane channel protein TolC [Pantoea sp. VH_24]